VASTTKRLLFLASLGLVVLVVVGFVEGALIKGPEGAFVSEPHIALPAEQIATLGSFSITNTLLSSWITTAVLIVLFFLATWRMSLVPRGLQNVVEVAVEALYNFVVGVAGERYGRRFFPIIATIFFFVVVNAWLGLLPIYQSLGITSDGRIFSFEPLKAHLLRPAGTDINMPLALALISFVYFEAWGLRAHGFGYLGEFVRIGGLLRGRIGMGVIDLLVGVLELFSHFIRAISLTFRLFGNMTAGEILLLVSAFLVVFVAPLPFYALEVLVGFVQALIFAGLTLVFAVVAVTPHEEEGH
jgi:F-type H+-transporting ATPase subunit a